MSENEPALTPEDLHLLMIEFESRVGNFDHLDDPDVLFEDSSSAAYDVLGEADNPDQKATAKIIGFWRGH